MTELPQDQVFTEDDLIHVYTRAQAIEDGFLVALNQWLTVKETRFPMAATAAVFGIIQRACENPRASNDYQGVIWDIAWMSRCYHPKGQETWIFPVTITGAGRQRLFRFKAMIHPGDEGEPVITISLPEED